MAYANGRFPPSGLTEVQRDVYLSTLTARAWRRAVAAAPGAIGRHLSIALPAGGYRSYSTQADMRVHPDRYNLNPGSTARLALPGYSKHGLGICVDVVGSRVDSVLINFLSKYGFTRPLYNDPNHFIHDGHTATGIETAVVHKPSKTSSAGGTSSATDRRTVKVLAGDSLAKIAARYGITFAHILALNQSIRNPNSIYPGQIIRIK